MGASSAYETKQSVEIADGNVPAATLAHMWTVHGAISDWILRGEQASVQ